MNIDKTFKTKTGYCHILPDQIVLTRDGVIGKLANVQVGETIWRILLMYGVLSIALLYFAYTNYVKGQVVKSVFMGVIGAYLVFGILSSINHSATPCIDRKKIKTIKFKKAISGLTRSRFEVIFENESGKMKKRLIMLPGSLTDGQNETEKALRIMYEEKLLTEI